MTGHIAPASIRAAFVPSEYYVVVHRLFALDDPLVWRPVYAGRGVFRRLELYHSPVEANMAFRDAVETYGAERVAIAKLVPAGIEVLPAKANPETLAPKSAQGAEP